MVRKVSLHITPKSLEYCSLVEKSLSDKAISPASNLLIGDIESQSIIKKFAQHPLPQLKKPELYDKTCGRILTSIENRKMLEEKERIKHEKQLQKVKRKEEREKRKTEKKKKNVKHTMYVCV